MAACPPSDRPFMLYGRYAGCGEWFTYWGYNTLVAQAFRTPNDPNLLATIDCAARYMNAIGCTTWSSALSNAATYMRTVQASLTLRPLGRTYQGPVLRPLGRTHPAGPSLPGAPGSIARIRAALSQAIATKQSSAIVQVLQNQLAAACAAQAHG